MNATRTPSLRIIDLACVLVVSATIAMYLVNQQSGAETSTAPTILTIAVAKSILISAAFMGLLWTSRLLFTVVSVSFVLLGFALVAILT